MTDAGPVSIREAARRVERDVKAVHSDIQAPQKDGAFAFLAWDMLYIGTHSIEVPMSIGSILPTGMQSLRSSINRTTIAGSNLNAENDDLASKMVAMNQGSIDAKASANVIKAADQILGTIIDIRG